MTPLEEEIKKIIEEEIDGKYVGKLQVNVDDDMYELLLHMNQEQAPLHLGIQGTEEDFKKFIKDEIHFRKKNHVSFWKAIREYTDDFWNFENVITL